MNEELRQDPASLLDERALVAAMLRQEAAQAQAQADLGLLAPEDAQSIVNTCKVDLFDVPHILRDSLLNDASAEPALIKSLRDSVRLFNPAAADAVHRWGHPGDLLCNALALVTRDVLHWVGQDVQALQARPAAMDVCRAWEQVCNTAQGALCLQLNPVSAPATWPVAEVRQKMAQTLGLTAASSEGTQAWMALGCALGVFILSAQRVASQTQAIHVPLWVAQWLTELSSHTLRPSDGRDFWRAQWPLWSTLVLSAARSAREVRGALKA